MRTMRGWKAAVLAGLFGSTIALGGVEWCARRQPPPRVQQVFDDTRNDFDVVDGVPVWTSIWQGRDRWNADCLSTRGRDRFDVMILGSSIFFGVQLDPQLSLGARLQDRLDARGGSHCVTNLAQPGFVMETQFATARQHWEQMAPRLVVWEIWHNSPNRFVLVDDKAYNFGDMVVDEHGLPNAFGLAPYWNRWWFSRLATYRFANLSRTPTAKQDSGEEWSRFVEDRLAPAVQWMNEQGAGVLLVFSPPLDRPFSESLARKNRSYGTVVSWADSSGVQTFDIAAALAGEDPAKLRLDPCCHFNARGTWQVAAALEDTVAARLEE